MKYFYSTNNYEDIIFFCKQMKPIRWTTTFISLVFRLYLISILATNIFWCACNRGIYFTSYSVAANDSQHLIRKFQIFYGDLIFFKPRTKTNNILFMHIYAYRIKRLILYSWCFTFFECIYIFISKLKYNIYEKQIKKIVNGEMLWTSFKLIT